MEFFFFIHVFVFSPESSARGDHPGERHGQRPLHGAHGAFLRSAEEDAADHHGGHSLKRVAQGGLFFLKKRGVLTCFLIYIKRVGWLLVVSNCMLQLPFDCCYLFIVSDSLFWLSFVVWTLCAVLVFQGCWGVDVAGVWCHDQVIWKNQDLGDGTGCATHLSDTHKRLQQFDNVRAIIGETRLVWQCLAEHMWGTWWGAFLLVGVGSFNMFQFFEKMRRIAQQSSLLADRFCSFVPPPMGCFRYFWFWHVLTKCQITLFATWPRGAWSWG